MKPDYKRWYNPKTGKYTDEPEVGCNAYIIFAQEERKVITNEIIKYIDWGSTRFNFESGIEYKEYDRDEDMPIEKVFPSKRALIESLLTPEEQIEIGASLCGKGAMYRKAYDSGWNDLAKLNTENALKANKEVFERLADK